MDHDGTAEEESVEENAKRVLNTDANKASAAEILPCSSPSLGLSESSQCTTNNQHHTVNSPELKACPANRRFRDMRRSRTIIQADQLDVLYGCYFKDPNPGKHEFEQISEWVHLPKKVVQIWFQNMRLQWLKSLPRLWPQQFRFTPQHSTPRRPRTHLNCLQLSILQSCYETCAHPNALECEAVGTELGLPLKVVQIWFQNTRAKEKRWRLQQEKMVRSTQVPIYIHNHCVSVLMLLK
uniref:Homeobox domain-containing protein n=1 Tax=Astyanax mexicanus TaxID=7994 RepID=A0A8B9KSA6_ASTMX